MAQLLQAAARWSSGDEPGARSSLRRLEGHPDWAVEVAFLAARMSGDADALADLRRACPDRSDIALAWADHVPPEVARNGLAELSRPSAAAVRRRVELEVETGSVDPAAARDALTAGDPATRLLRSWMACLAVGSVTLTEVSAHWARLRSRRLDPRGTTRPEGPLPDCPAAWRPPPEPSGEPFEPPEVGGIRFDGDVAEIVVVAEGPDALRERLERRLADLGYGEPRRKGDRIVFPSDGLARPKVILRNDGRFEIVPVTVVPPDPDNPALGAHVAGPRQRRASRARLFDAISDDLRTWRRAVFDRATSDGLSQRLGRELRELWEDGRGGAIPTAEARREALLELWVSRPCTGLGNQARDVIEAYLDLVVMSSDQPVTAAELAEHDEACGRQLELYGVE